MRVFVLVNFFIILRIIGVGVPIAWSHVILIDLCVFWEFSLIRDDLILNLLIIVQFCHGSRDWLIVVLMRSSVVFASHESTEFVALAGHHDAEDNEQDALEDESSFERVNPHWVLRDVSLDGPESLLSHMEDGHAEEERHDTHGFQDVVDDNTHLHDLK
jgi:hypothetical protein